MKVIITGSEGNIGTQLVPYLKKCGHTVFRVDHKQKFEEDYKCCDILKEYDLYEVFNQFKPEVVIHLAAMVSRVVCEYSNSLTVSTNVVGTDNIACLCNFFGAKMIHFSTSEVYGNIGGYLSEDRKCEPNNIYGLTKLISEKFVGYYLKNAVIVRPFMLYHEREPYGNNHSALIRFAYDLKERRKITVHKDSKRAWMHIDDFVKVIERLIYVDGFHVVNTGTDELISTEELARKICEFYDIDYSDYVVETPIPAQMTLEKYPDIRRQFTLTGIVPEIYIDEGLKRVLNYINQ